MNEVQRAAKQAREAQSALAAAVRKARDEGQSLRAVAKDAGMSHEQVRRLTQ